MSHYVQMQRSYYYKTAPSDSEHVTVYSNRLIPDIYWQLRGCMIVMWALLKHFSFKDFLTKIKKITSESRNKCCSLLLAKPHFSNIWNFDI